MTITFFGHRELYHNIEPGLVVLLRHLIETKGADCFYVGNHGQFDLMVQRILSRLQKEYPHIRCEIVLAYLPQNNAEPFCLPTVFPQAVEEVFPRRRIFARNQWMLD